MNLSEEIDVLPRYLDQLAREMDDELIKRYELKRPPMPPGFYWRLRWLAGRILRSLRSIRILRPEPWPVSLKQVSSNAKAKPLLIWAIGADREKLRLACDGLSRMRSLWSGFAPVLVTDVADFAFFSRLGWLVEYVPRLAGEGMPYEERKMQLLARLYHGAPVLPVRLGLESNCRAEDIRRWLNASWLEP